MKSREFWIHKYHDNQTVLSKSMIYEIEPEYRNNWTHVIEKSAYDKLQARIEELEKKIIRYRAREINMSLRTYDGQLTELDDRIKELEGACRELGDGLESLLPAATWFFEGPYGNSPDPESLPKARAVWRKHGDLLEGLK